MSLAQLECAVAELIRLPELNRSPDAYEAFRNRYDLDAAETAQLDILAKDPNVVKYGRAMAFVRWETIVKQTPFSMKFWNPDAAQYVWRHLFEPTACQVRFRALGAAYLNFIMVNKEAQRIFKESSPPFVLDLLKFEAAQANVRFENTHKLKSPPPGSPLVHMAYSIEHYNYQISDFLYKSTRRRPDEANPITPQAGEETLLVIPKGDSTHCRFFVVGPELKSFLDQAQEGCPKESPESSKDLVELGLIKS